MSIFSSISFAQPWILLLLLGLPLLYRYRSKRKYYAEMKFSSGQGFGKYVTWRTRWQPILHVFQILSLAMLIIALARPQQVFQKEKVLTDGIDIMMAMDVSSSMLAKDFEEDRLDASKKVAVTFVEKRKYDRLGLVVFGGESFTQCPLTADHDILKQMISSLACGIAAEGTAIGMGLAHAVRRLQKSNSKSKVIILLTDGVNNAGSVDPLQAAAAAQKYGVKVYTIGVGTNGRAKAPVARKPNGGFIYNYVTVEIDEALLTEIANQTGGKYFRATDLASLESIYEQINQMEKTKIEKKSFRKYSEKFYWFVWASMFFIFLYLLLSNTLFRTILQ
jgi:Ca-activated chloride channel family protein